MVTFYEETDVVSFAQYMMSDYRKQSILAIEEITEEKKEELLQVVTGFDFANWLELVREQDLQVTKALADDLEEDENEELSE